MVRKRLCTVLLLIWLLSGLCLLPVRGESASYTASLGFASADWKVQEWGAHASTTVTGPGNYRIRYTGSAQGAGMLVIDIFGAADGFRAQKLYVSDLRILVDEEPISVDLSKVVTGDLSEDGNYRISIYDPYGDSKNSPAVVPEEIVFSQSLIVEFTISAGAPPEVQEPSGTEPTVSVPVTEHTGTAPSSTTQTQLQVQGSGRSWVIALVIGLFTMISAFAVAVFLVQKKKR